MDTFNIIIILVVILIVLVILNFIKFKNANPNTTCSTSTFGCCPNGIDSKMNFYGTNCPSYTTTAVIVPKPLPPPPQPVPPPPHPIYIVPQPIGGCAGTRYGCCPDNTTPKIDEQGSNCIIKYPQPVGGCAGTQYGCCPDGTTAKIDSEGSNCV